MIKGFEFLLEKETLIAHYEFNKVLYFFQFKDEKNEREYLLNLYIPFNEHYELEWYFGELDETNSNLDEWIDYRSSSLENLPESFRKIVLQTKQKIKKRDRVRKIFNK